MDTSLATTTEQPPAPTEDLSAVLAESMERIQEQEVTLPKRPRGRPPGEYGSYKKRGRRSQRPRGLKAVPDAPAEENQSADPQPAPAAIEQTVTVDRSVIVKMLATPVQIISRIPAKRLGVDELEFDQNESMQFAECIEGVLNAYAPNLEKMDPKTAALFQLGAVSVALISAKYDVYQRVMLERRAKLQAEQPEIKNAAENNEPRKPEHGQNLTKSVFARV